MSKPSSPPPTKAKVALTKAQRESEVIAELISLCQTVTEDGTLADEEVESLRDWLADNGTSDLPAISFLRDTVSRILADGVVTPEERFELQKALESILPPEIRKDAEDVRQRLEPGTWERNRSVKSINFMVAGARYEGRPAAITSYVKELEPAYLVRDRKNKFSRHAIEVRTAGGHQIGFVPEEFARDATDLLDKGFIHSAYFSKILTGGRFPNPVVQAHFYHPDADREGAIGEAAVPKKAEVRPVSGCLPLVLVGLVVIAWRMVA